MSLVDELLAVATTHELPIRIAPADLAAAAASLDVVWPASYEALLLALNGRGIDFFTLYRVVPPDAPASLRSDDIVQANRWLRTERQCPNFPDWLLAFYADGCGNYEGLDLRGRPGNYEIVMWDHDIAWDEDATPEDATSRSAADFDEWLTEQIKFLRER
jgi:hypothetical protein